VLQICKTELTIAYIKQRLNRLIESSKAKETAQQFIKRLSSPKGAKAAQLPDQFKEEALYDSTSSGNPLYTGPPEKMASLEQQFEAAAEHFAKIVESAADKDKLVMYALVSGCQMFPR
jgi:hypothetical protein